MFHVRIRIEYRSLFCLSNQRPADLDRHLLIPTAFLFRDAALSLLFLIKAVFLDNLLL